MGQRGISMIAAILTLLTLGMFGASIVAVVSEEQELRTLAVQQTNAFYIAMTGLEYGLREITEAGYPNATNKPFAGGTFTTQVNAAAHVMTVAASAGSARRNYQINVSLLAGDCTALDTTGAVPIGSKKDEINRVKIQKSCLNKVRFNRFQASWTPDSGQKLLRLDFDNEIIYDNPSGVPSGTIVDVTGSSILTDNNSHDFSRIIFTSNISGVTMTITVYFTDGSSTSATWYVN